MLVSCTRRAALIVGLALAGLPATSHAELIHRYSFNDKDAVKDSVGHVDGKLVGAATLDGKNVVLKNDGKTSDDDTTARVEFDQPILPKSGSASLVFWFRASQVDAYARVLDFGNKDGAGGTAFIYFTPRDADDQSRAAISATNAAGKTAVNNDRLDDGKEHMVAIVIDGAAKKLHVYIDGKEPTLAEDLGDNTLDKVDPKKNWLGRSEFDGDPGFTGSIDEMRVYDQPLSAADIAAAAAAGPDQVPPPTTQPATTTQPAATTQPSK
jgi:hypothetical protein